MITEYVLIHDVRTAVQRIPAADLLSHEHITHITKHKYKYVPNLVGGWATPLKNIN